MFKTTNSSSSLSFLALSSWVFFCLLVFLFLNCCYFFFFFYSYIVTTTRTINGNNVSIVFSSTTGTASVATLATPPPTTALARAQEVVVMPSSSYNRSIKIQACLKIKLLTSWTSFSISRMAVARTKTKLYILTPKLPLLLWFILIWLNSFSSSQNPALLVLKEKAISVLSHWVPPPKILTWAKVTIALKLEEKPRRR